VKTGGTGDLVLREDAGKPGSSNSKESRHTRHRSIRSEGKSTLAGAVFQVGAALLIGSATSSAFVKKQSTEHAQIVQYAMTDLYVAPKFFQIVYNQS
jgi:hypothetical protein